MSKYLFIVVATIYCLQSANIVHGLESNQKDVLVPIKNTELLEMLNLYKSTKNKEILNDIDSLNRYDLMCVLRYGVHIDKYRNAVKSYIYNHCKDRRITQIITDLLYIERGEELLFTLNIARSNIDNRYIEPVISNSIHDEYSIEKRNPTAPGVETATISTFKSSITLLGWFQNDSLNTLLYRKYNSAMELIRELDRWLDFWINSVKPIKHDNILNNILNICINQNDETARKSIKDSNDGVLETLAFMIVEGIEVDCVVWFIHNVTPDPRLIPLLLEYQSDKLIKDIENVLPIMSKIKSFEFMKYLFEKGNIDEVYKQIVNADEKLRGRMIVLLSEIVYVLSGGEIGDYNMNSNDINKIDKLEVESWKEWWKNNR